MQSPGNHQFFLVARRLPLYFYFTVTEPQEPEEKNMMQIFILGMFDCLSCTASANTAHCMCVVKWG